METGNQDTHDMSSPPSAFTVLSSSTGTDTITTSSTSTAAVFSGEPLPLPLPAQAPPTFATLPLEQDRTPSATSSRSQMQTLMFAARAKKAWSAIAKTDQRRSPDDLPLPEDGDRSSNTVTSSAGSSHAAPFVKKFMAAMSFPKSKAEHLQSLSASIGVPLIPEVTNAQLSHPSSTGDVLDGIVHEPMVDVQDPLSPTTDCPACLTLWHEVVRLNRIVAERDEQVRGCQRDIDIMGEKLVEEIEKRAELDLNLIAMDSELEDLSQKLFSEANMMVSNANRAQAEAEEKVKNCDRDILQFTMLLEKIALVPEGKQLLVSLCDGVIPRAISHILESKGSAERTHVENDTTVRTSRGALAHLTRELSDGLITGPVSPSDGPVVGSLVEECIPLSDVLDTELLSEFQNFVIMKPRVAFQDDASNVKQFQNTPFMKRSLEEDVKPCLRPQFSSSSASEHQAMLSKLVDAVVANTCYMERVSYRDLNDPVKRTNAIKTSATQSSHRRGISLPSFQIPGLKDSKQSQTGLPSPDRKTGVSRCCLCSQVKQCQYQIKMSAQQDAPWLPIDTFCRSRVVAVCEFYTFTRHVRQGLYAKRSVLDLWAECCRLKEHMFRARVGVVSGRSLTAISDMANEVPNSPVLPASPSSTPAAAASSTALSSNDLRSKSDTTLPLDTTLTVQNVKVHLSADTAALQDAAWWHVYKKALSSLPPAALPTVESRQLQPSLVKEEDEGASGLDGLSSEPEKASPPLTVVASPRTLLYQISTESSPRPDGASISASPPATLIPMSHSSPHPSFQHRRTGSFGLPSKLSLQLDLSSSAGAGAINMDESSYSSSMSDTGGSPDLAAMESPPSLAPSVQPSSHSPSRHSPLVSATPSLPTAVMSPSPPPPPSSKTMELSNTYPASNKVNIQSSSPHQPPPPPPPPVLMMARGLNTRDNSLASLGAGAGSFGSTSTPASLSSASTSVPSSLPGSPTSSHPVHGSKHTLLWSPRENRAPSGSPTGADITKDTAVPFPLPRHTGTKDDRIDNDKLLKEKIRGGGVSHHHHHHHHHHHQIDDDTAVVDTHAIDDHHDGGDDPEPLKLSDELEALLRGDVGSRD